MNPKEKKYLAKKLLGQTQNLETKNIIIHNMYEGEEAVCLTTGSSLLDFSPKFLKEKIGNKIIFAVKTAALRHKDIIDVCVSNMYNTFDSPVDFLMLSRKEAPIGSANYIANHIIDNSTFKNNWINEPDIIWGSWNCGGHSKSVCYTNRWMENSIECSPINRILGPGVLNDMAIPIMIHMGIKKISFIGWDGSSVKSNGTIDHFYDVEKEFYPTMNAISSRFNLNNLKSDLPIDEQKIVQRAEIDILNYFNELGIEIEILNKNSNVTDKIKRNYWLYE